MWMNEHEIDRALDLVGQHAPEFLPYVKYLSDWRDVINQNSDGWPYWSAGTRPAGTLQELISKLVESTYRSGVAAPSEKEFQKALVPIKSFATRKNLPIPVLGGATSSQNVLQRGDAEFVKWVEGTLVGNLKKDGLIEIAQDFERFVRIVKELRGS